MNQRTSQQYKRGLTILDWLVTLLSLYVVVQVALDVVVEWSDKAEHFFMLADFWICVIFMLDWGASLATAPSKGEFLRKRWIDLIASIPFVEGLRFLRIVRAVRIIRLFRFLRGVRGLAHLLRLIAGNRTRSLFTIYISCTAVILAYCSLGFYTFETSINKNIASYGDALWLAFTTLTTVGYGDVYPVTSSGRFIAVALVITGLGLFSLMTAEFATIFMRYAKEDKNRNSKREE